MRKILLPVDGSANAERAAHYAVSLAADCPQLDVLLVNVQEDAGDFQSGRFLKKEEIEAMALARGGDALQAAREALEAGGVRFTPQVLIGPPAETIARLARERGCHAILMGTRGLGALASVVMGSVTREVVRLAEVPVTLVK